MARGPEGAFWKRVRKAWKWHSVRIEASDGEVEVGTPDTVLSAGGRGGFIELKVWPDNVSGEQLAWHVDALDRGAYAMVLAELHDGKVWLGRAEEWDRLLGEREVVRIVGMDLHRALAMIESALIGVNRNGGSDGMERRSTKGRGTGKKA